jgi:hypothetical protein
VAEQKKCIYQCPSCKGNTCSRRTTMVKKQVLIADMSETLLLCDVVDGLVSINRRLEVGEEVPKGVNVVDVYDWLPADGRVCRFGGVSFQYR